MTLQLYLTIIWRHTTCFSARKQFITHIWGLVCWPIVTKLPTFFQVFNNFETAVLFVFISLDLVGEMSPFSYFKGIPGTNTIIAKLEVIDCAYSIPFGFPALFYYLCPLLLPTDLTSDTTLWDSIASLMSDAVTPNLGFHGRDFSVADIFVGLRITKIVHWS